MTGEAPDYIADAKAFRARRPVEKRTVCGLVWKYIDTGAGQQDECLLLCPGTLGNADIFRNVIDALAPDIRIVSVTYPFTGDAMKIADGAVALLQQLRVGRAHVLGSSLGGVIAQTISARHPEKVDRLFIANSLASVDVIRSGFLRTEEQVLATPLKALKGIVTQSLDGWPEPAPEFAAIKAFLANELAERFTGRGFRARILASVRLSAIPVARTPAERMTIIQADDDPLISPAARRTVVDRYPGAAVHTFESGGHFPYLTRADAYVDLLRRRLSG